MYTPYAHDMFYKSVSDHCQRPMTCLFFKLATGQPHHMTTEAHPTHCLFTESATHPNSTTEDPRAHGLILFPDLDAEKHEHIHSYISLISRKSGARIFGCFGASRGRRHWSGKKCDLVGRAIFGQHHLRAVQNDSHRSHVLKWWGDHLPPHNIPILALEEIGPST